MLEHPQDRAAFRPNRVALRFYLSFLSFDLVLVLPDTKKSFDSRDSFSSLSGRTQKYIDNGALAVNLEDLLFSLEF